MFYKTNNPLETPLWTPRPRRLQPTSAERGSPAPFHHGLNSRFGMPHPSLASFLNWLQKCHFEVSVADYNWLLVNHGNNAQQQLTFTSTNTSSQPS